MLTMMAVHDPDFRQAENDFKAFLDVMTEKLIEVDDTVPELPVKDIVGLHLAFIGPSDKDALDLPDIQRRALLKRSYALQGESV